MDHKGDDDVVDRISELPDHVLHHILSFLPDKQAFQTALMSKTWKHVITTFPMLQFNRVFNGSDFWCPENKNKPDVMRKKGHFYTSVEKTLRNRRNQSLRIKTFSLFDNLLHEKSMSRVDCWINLVLESEVEELALSFGSSNIHYRLPHSVLVAKSLCVLTLRKCKLVSTCGEGDINLPSLKRFSLFNVYADDQSIQNLIVGCPVIEYMGIENCWGIRNIKFFSVPTVKEIIVGNNFDIERLELEASNLHSLYIIEWKLQCNLNLLPFKNLKNLSLNTPNVTEKWLEEHLSGLPLLENLRLLLCSELERINISSHHHLKSLELILCDNLVELMIDNPKLCRLSYWGKTAISFSLNALGLLEAEYTLWPCYGTWDADKIEFLSKMRNSKVFKLKINSYKVFLLLFIYLFPYLIFLFSDFFHFIFYLFIYIYIYVYINSNQFFCLISL